MDIRQSPAYAQFIRNLGWQVEKIGRWNIFIKKFPLVGSLIKIQRIIPPIPFEEIETIAKKHRAFQIILEPTSFPHIPQTPHGYHPLKSPFIPTKTLTLNLKPTETETFNNFSKNKRRDIRIAERNKLVIKEGTPEEFIFLKRKSLLEKFILPIGDRKDILALNKAFSLDICFLIAYSSNPVAGILLLFHQKTAYYWQAAATEKGKKLMAPTLLLWEAIKLAKKKGCTKFDFEGVYDERFPQNKSWLGFTHFKQGFGGKEAFYPEPSVKNRLPFL